MEGGSCPKKLKLCAENALARTSAIESHRCTISTGESESSLVKLCRDDKSFSNNLSGCRNNKKHPIKAHHTSYKAANGTSLAPTSCCPKFLDASTPVAAATNCSVVLIPVCTERSSSVEDHTAITPRTPKASMGEPTPTTVPERASVLLSPNEIFKLKQNSDESSNIISKSSLRVQCAASVNPSSSLHVPVRRRGRTASSSKTFSRKYDPRKRRRNSQKQYDVDNGGARLFRCQFCLRLSSPPSNNPHKNSRRRKKHSMMVRLLKRRRRSTGCNIKGGKCTGLDNYGVQDDFLLCERPRCVRKRLKERRKKMATPPEVEGLKEEKKEIKEAFSTLRGILPPAEHSDSEDSESEKVSTLRLAASYIQALSDLLNGTHLTEEHCLYEHHSTSASASASAKDDRKFANYFFNSENANSGAFLTGSSLSFTTGGDFSFKGASPPFNILPSFYNKVEHVMENLHKIEHPLQCI